MPNVDSGIFVLIRGSTILNVAEFKNNLLTDYQLAIDLCERLIDNLKANEKHMA